MPTSSARRTCSVSSNDGYTPHFRSALIVWKARDRAKNNTCIPHIVANQANKKWTQKLPNFIRELHYTSV